MWVRICRCVYRCTGVEVTFWCCDSGDSYVVLLRQDLPLGPEVCVLGRLDWLVSRPQVPACLTSPALGFQVWAAMPSFDTGQGMTAKSSCLLGKRQAFCPFSLSPAIVAFFFNNFKFPSLQVKICKAYT